MTEMEREGFRHADISVLFPHNEGTKDFALEKGTKAPEGVAAGATSGAVIGTNELPNLPPSVMATLNSDRTSGGYTPTALSPVLETELPAADFVISGQQLIGIDVVR